MGSTIALIMAVAKAVPIIDNWIQQIVVAYTNSQIDSMKKEDRDAIKAAIDQCDQRELEKAMGSSKAGELSGNPGTEVVNKLPGVQ